MRNSLIGVAASLALASSVAAEVKVDRVPCPGEGQCVRLANGTVEVLVATAIGPRIVRYGFVGGDNLLGWVPESSVKTELGEWKPWGGHRLWSAPEHMPRSYSPDNEPVDVQVSGRTVTLTQAVEPKTGIQKILTVTLAETGTGVTVGHRLVNRSLWDIQVSPWALTIMNTGRHDHPAAGTVRLARRRPPAGAGDDVVGVHGPLGPTLADRAEVPAIAHGRGASRIAEGRNRQPPGVGGVSPGRRTCS